MSGAYAYVADGESGLYIVDVSDPAHPCEAAFYDTPGNTQGVAVSAHYAYIADMAAGLRIVDVSNPTDPTETGSYNTLGDSRGIAVSGDYAYVADEAGGLRIVDISDSAAPREAGFYDTPGTAYGVTVSRNYAYIADMAAGMRIVDISNPTDPTETGFYNTPGYAWDVAVSGDYAYVADGDGGLVILRILKDKVTGSILASGGNLLSTGGDTALIFPRGAFTQTVTLTYRHLLSDQDTEVLAGIGHTFELTAVYSDTHQPAQLVSGQTYTITVQYTEAERGPIIEETLALYWWNGSQWVQEASSAVDNVSNTVMARSSHLSTWAVLGETRRVYLPLVFKRY